MLRRKRDEITAETLPLIYAELYRRVYGRDPAHTHTKATLRHLERAVEQADQYRVPIRTWINANLHGMKMAVKDGQHRKYGFQPNMLRGEKALNRVRVFVEKGRRRVGRDTSEAFDRDNPKRAIEDDIVASEAEIVTTMLLRSQRGEPVTFDVVATEIAGNLTWEVFDRVRREGHSNVMVQLTLNGDRDDHERRFFQHVNKHDLDQIDARVPTQALEIALGRLSPKLPDAVGTQETPSQSDYAAVAAVVASIYPIDTASTGPPDSYRPSRYNPITNMT